MSTYNIKLTEQVTFLTFVEYAKQYTSWKTLAVAMIDGDDDDKAISGNELKHVERLCEFLKKETDGQSISVYVLLDVIYVSARYNPKSEGQAKRIVLNSIPTYKCL